ncbi:MAG TPA: L-fucose/L-arabinose isomerase family protein [Spirochaetia bacterium]|nr:L-fucose/L-arabinose isomerase family protein [Spirochaetia bacterium]
MTTLGVLVGNRGFFPAELCEQGRKVILSVLKEQGLEAVALGPKDTKYGSVESLADARKCAELFKANRDTIDGILVTLPNFGDERGVADTIKLAGLDVPVLMHAFPDEPGRMNIEHRRDAFCGKMSACNSLSQYGIRYSLTSEHTMDPESDRFRQDLADFAGVCRVVKGLRRARFAQIGARPAAFTTVRYSEKLLERTGISVESIDLSEVFGRAWSLNDKESAVLSKLDEIRGYVKTNRIPRESLLRMAKFGVVVDQCVAERELSGAAVQCWTSMQENFGVVPCAVMSMLSNTLVPAACETDMSGLLGMYAMIQASGKPSGIADWNNNYADDPDKCVLFHCSNFPQEFFANKGVMDYQEIIAGTVGRDKSYGTVTGRLTPTDFTYCRVSTDDFAGKIRAYVGEGEITSDPITTFGGYAVARIPRLQALLRHICSRGFEHHVAINPSRVAAVIDEAFTRYLGWDVYNHDRMGAAPERQLPLGQTARGREREERREEKNVGRARPRAGKKG